MKRTVFMVTLAMCLLLSGCGTLLRGEYIWVQDHEFPVSPGSNQNISAATYQQLYDALASMVEAGTQAATISVERYDRNALNDDINKVVDQIGKTHPIAAYAVGSVTCALGTSGGEMALAVEITYIHDQSEIRKIKRAADNASAEKLIAQALTGCDTGIVILIEDYESTDFTQMVENYALQHPEYVMETPQVTENLYPEEGKRRVVELRFTYQTSRESLKSMQSRVEPVFASAELYVSGDGAAYEKLSQLYSFLMERYDYKIETSITPSYSLLRHGVGDCKAFAAVYAAMCRWAGLECQIVSGTREGERWYWNIVLDDGVYYHVDLLRCSEDGAFSEKSDEEMTGYVWDYSAYPACGPQEQKNILE